MKILKFGQITCATRSVEGNTTLACEKLGKHDPQ